MSKALKILTGTPVDPDQVVMNSTITLESGPLITLCRDAEGYLCLAKWCDQDETYSRWLMARVTEEVLLDFLSGRTCLLLVLLRPEAGPYVIFDMTTEGIARAMKVQAHGIPSVYLPEQGTPFDFGGTPEGTQSAMIQMRERFAGPLQEQKRRLRELQREAVEALFNPELQ